MKMRLWPVRRRGDAAGHGPFHPAHHARKTEADHEHLARMVPVAISSGNPPAPISVALNGSGSERASMTYQINVARSISPAATSSRGNAGGCNRQRAVYLVERLFSMISSLLRCESNLSTPRPSFTYGQSRQRVKLIIDLARMLDFLGQDRGARPIRR